MKPARRSPLFLERETYRRRRIMDAARILPVVGFVLILLPVLWTQSGRMGTAGQAIYLFVLWLGLIVAAGLMSRSLRAALRREIARPDPASAALALQTPVPDASPPAAPHPGDKDA